MVLWAWLFTLRKVCSSLFRKEDIVPIVIIKICKNQKIFKILEIDGHCVMILVHLFDWQIKVPAGVSCAIIPGHISHQPCVLDTDSVPGMIDPPASLSIHQRTSLPGNVHTANAHSVEQKLISTRISCASTRTVRRAAALAWMSDMIA